jgi:hypothetical protein
VALKLRKPEFEWYILKAYGNRERWLKGEESNPCEAEIKVPTYQDARELQKKIDPTLGKLPESANDEHFGKFVRTIKGLEFEGVPVTTGAELIKLKSVMPADVVTELFIAINMAGTLEEGLRRNLGSPRSLDDSTQQNDGTAKAVEPAA